MRRRSRHEYFRTQKSVFFYQDLIPDNPRRRAREFASQLYPHMFYEDVRLSIAPIGGRSDNPNFRVSVDPESDDAGGLVEEGLARRGHSTSLADAVCDFMQEAAGLLVVYGEATYETVYLSEQEGGQPVRFELDLIPSGTVTQKGSRTIQRIPDTLARETGRGTEIELDSQSLLRFELEPGLRKVLNRMVESLAFLSNNIMPDFVFKYDLADPKRPPFEDAEHVRARKMALAEVTRSIGWDARRLFADELLEYYQLKRMMRFEAFKADIRSLLLDGLNQHLREIGRQLQVEVQIRIEGLPMREDVEAAVRGIETGDRPFNDIIKPFIRI